MTKTARKPNALRSITEPEWNALSDYARNHGRTWKAALKNDWMRGTPGLAPELRKLRNDLGTRWLDAFQFKQRKPRSTEDYAKHSLSGGFGIGPKAVRTRNGAPPARKRNTPQEPRFYALAQDKFMSGWGGAAGGISFFAIAAPDQQSAKNAAVNLSARGEMKLIRVVKKLPRISAPNHLSVVDIKTAHQSHWYTVKPEVRKAAAEAAPLRSLETAIERMYAKVDEFAGSDAAEKAEEALVLWVPLTKPSDYRSDCLEHLTSEYGAADAKKRMKGGIPGIFVKASDVVRGYGFEGDLSLGYAAKGKVYTTEHCDSVVFVHRPDIRLGRAVAVDENMEMFPISKAITALTNLYAFETESKRGEPHFSTERSRRGY